MSKRIIFIFIFLLFGLLPLKAELSGRKLLDSLLKEYVNCKNKDTNYVVLLNNIAKQIYQYNSDSALFFSNKGLNYSKYLNFRQGIAYCYNSLGIAYWSKSNFYEAKSYFEKALEINKELNRIDEIAKNYGNLGIIYKTLSEYTTAIDYYYKALNYHEIVGSKQKIANTLTNIGALFKEQKDYKTAKNYYLRAYKVNEEIKDKRAQAAILSNIGFLFKMNNQYDSALYYVKQSIILSKQINHDLQLANGFNNLGLIYTEIKEYNLALDNFRLSLSIHEYIKRDHGIMSNYSGIGTVYLGLLRNNVPNSYSKKQLFKMAEDTLLLAFNISKQLNTVSDEMQISEALSDLYAYMNNWENAYYYMALHNRINDSISNEEIKFKVDGIAKLRENEKKDIELSILNTKYNSQRMSFVFVSTLIIMIICIIIYFMKKLKESNSVLKIRNLEITSINEQLAEQNRIISESSLELETLNEDLQTNKERLAIANATKDKFFSIISHDLKSPFTGFIGLTDLLANESDKMSVEEIKKIGKSLHESTHNTYALLTNLLDWSRLQSESINFIPENNIFNELLTSALNPLKNSIEHKSIKLTTNILFNNIYCDYNMIATVIRNLTTNAVKFTPNNGTIDITFNNNYSENSKSYYIFSIKDNGVGMNENISNNIFKIDHHISTKGTNNETGTGLGLILCKEFIEIHNGRIWVDSKPNQGTIFNFILPIPI